MQERGITGKGTIWEVVQFQGGGWLKVRWQWERWPMSNVHNDWTISDETSRRRTHVLTYDNDEIGIDLSSLPNSQSRIQII